MRHVFGVFRLFCATVAMVAILPATISTVTAASSSPSKSVPLPPCGAGRIVNFDTLALSDCTISGNSTSDPGGGVENYGVLELTNVVISGNTGASGGGIYNGFSGTLTLTHVILSSNVAVGVGGGLHNDGTVFLSDVTISENTSGAGGGGLANFGSIIGAGVALLGNQTLAGDGGGVLNDASMCLSAGTDFDECFASPAGGHSLVRDNYAAGNGGGVANLGTMALGDATVDHNRAEGGNGGGVWNFGTTQLANVTISRNTTTGDGGGLFNGDFGSVCCATFANYFAVNLTIAGNHANGNGGGVYTTTFSFTGLGSSTIADNTANGTGGGVENDDASGAFTELMDTLLARNGQNCAGSIFSSGHNLDTGLTCGLTGPGDTSDVHDDQVGLGVLAANGGPARGSAVVFDPLLTMALDPASPAVDAGSGSCPATDERGVARPQGAGCDIGAFELGTSGTTTLTVSITAANKIYDTTTAATIIGCTLSGSVGTDDVSCATSEAAFDSANVGTDKTVTATVTLTGAAAANYELASSSATTTADITVAAASVTPSAASKTYGTADPVLTGTMSGFFAADHITATYARTPGESVVDSPYVINAALDPRRGARQLRRHVQHRPLHHYQGGRVGHAESGQQGLRRRRTRR